MASILTWKLVDDIAAELGVTVDARMKWRQRRDGVPPKWRIKILEVLMQRAIPVSLTDFDGLEQLPGRIASPPFLPSTPGAADTAEREQAA